MAYDPLSSVPENYGVLRDTLSALRKYWPEKYASLSESRIKGWIADLSGGGRTESDLRSDIFRHVVTEQGLMDLGTTKEQAANIISGKATLSDFLEGEGGATTKALPKGSKLVKVGNSYRVIWSLGDGLGWSWYSISPDHLKQLYKDTTPPVAFSFSNKAQFEGRFGNLYWGNVQEISLKAETPWDDLKEKIYSQFGHVPGMDDKEIRRLLIQAYFEGWNENEWVVHYRNTNYYNKLSDDQRAWHGISQAEKDQRVTETSVQMAEYYESIWGVSKSAKSFREDALKIASGQTSLESWQFSQKRSAQKEEGTPAWAAARQQAREGREEMNRQENMTLFAADEWRAWTGPVDMPEGWSEKWGSWLATGKRSEADLQEYLKKVSSARWAYKPPDVSWQDWAASYKSQIKDELELATIDDKDQLLGKILNTDLSGQDLVQMIRQDNRFLSTQKMHGELSSAVSDMGRRFGFIT